MTNEELFTDLKQFIAATVSQEVDGLRKGFKTDIAGLRAELKTDIKTLNEKLDTIQGAIAETLTHTAEVTDATLQDHERRLRRLERQSA